MYSRNVIVFINTIGEVLRRTAWNLLDFIKKKYTMIYTQNHINNIFYVIHEDVYLL